MNTFFDAVSGTLLPSVLEAAVGPVHCGKVMVTTPVPTLPLPWAQFHTGADEWVCTCGFRRDAFSHTNPLAAVRAAGARLESIQWELDSAALEMEPAVKAVASDGYDTETLSLESGMTNEEIADLLAGTGIREKVPTAGYLPVRQ